VGEANTGEDSNAIKSSSAALKGNLPHVDDESSSEDANSEDDNLISTPLAQSKAITTLHKSKAGRGLQSVSALGTPLTLTLPLTLNLNASFAFFVGKRSFDSPLANGGGGGTGGGGGGAGSGGGGTPAPTADDIERAESLLLIARVIHATNDIAPYPVGQQTPTPFMYWSVHKDRACALALIKRYNLSPNVCVMCLLICLSCVY
jgi:hypothetical protein